MNKFKYVLLTVIFSVLLGCKGLGISDDSSEIPFPTGVNVNSSIIKDLGFLKIQETPSGFKDFLSHGYRRYVGYEAPNGKNIHIFIQDQLTEFQIARVYNVLSHYLTTDSSFEHDKSNLANTMANNNAVLKLQNGSDTPAYQDNLWGQPLYYNEIQVEGGKWYMDQDYDSHRDATYEEILHLVHDNGIGVLGSDENFTGLPNLQKALNDHQKAAYENNVWVPSSEDYTEWKNEISLDQEYLAAVIDAYYGLWGAWNSTSPDTSMWGSYNIKTRNDFTSGNFQDNVIQTIQNLFHPTFQYTAYISDQLTGEFSMKFDVNKPYTHHSQYLDKIKLNGSNNIKVIPNERANSIEGNEGYTTVVLEGNRDSFNIEYSNDGKSPVAVKRTGLGDLTLIKVDAVEFR